MSAKLVYNRIEAVAGRPETNNNSAIVSVSGVPMAVTYNHIVGFGKLLPATGYTSYRDSGAFCVGIYHV